MGSPIGQRYLKLLDHHVIDGVTLFGCGMNDEMRLRTIIVKEAWAIWLKNPMIKQLDLVRRISTRIYAEVLDRAKTDERWARLVENTGLKPGMVRTPAQLRNDVEALDHLVAVTETPARAIEKAKVQHSSDWLIQRGMEKDDTKAVASGAKLKMELNGNFDEKEQDYSKVANVQVNITGDVSVVKPDRHNYTEEEKRKFAKDHGMTVAEVQDLIEGQDYEEVLPGDVEAEEVFDPFLLTENALNGNG